VKVTAPTGTAMILAAGFGTRMEPLTRERAKPALRLLDHPLIAWAMAGLADASVKRLVVNLHHLPESLEPDLERYARRLGLSLALSRETGAILGTGGGLGAAAPLLLEGGAGTMALLNGDSLWFGDLAEAGRRHRAGGGIASMLLQPPPPGSGYGAVETDAGGCVVSIAGAPEPASPPAARWMFIGVHLLEPDLLQHIPAGRPSDINAGIYRGLIRRGVPVQGLPVRWRWLDFGTPRAFLASALAILAHRVSGTPTLDLPLDPPGQFIAGDRPAYVGPSAELAPGAEIDESIVGEGGFVAEGAHLRRSLLMEHCRLGRGVRLDGCLVGPGTELPDGFSAAGELLSRGEDGRPARRALGGVVG